MLIHTTMYTDGHGALAGAVARHAGRAHGGAARVGCDDLDFRHGSAYATTIRRSSFQLQQLAR